MNKTIERYTTWLAVTAAIALGFSSSASAQVPVPSTSTPTVHGGTPINGSAILGEIGFAALRGSFYTGGSTQDFGIELGMPTFGHDELPGWGQSVGIDARAPFRFLLARWAKANGALKVGPYFHVGKACHWDDWDGWDGWNNNNFRGRRGCGTRNIGLGLNLGFVTDIALPKLFKLIVGIEQQLGLLNRKNRDANWAVNDFAGATWVTLGLEALWRKMFFTMLINAGAQYGSNRLYYRDHGLYRHMVGFGYKFR